MCMCACVCVRARAKQGYRSYMYGLASLWQATTQNQKFNNCMMYVRVYMCACILRESFTLLKMRANGTTPSVMCVFHVCSGPGHNI